MGGRGLVSTGSIFGRMGACEVVSATGCSITRSREHTHTVLRHYYLRTRAKTRNHDWNVGKCRHREKYAMNYFLGLRHFNVFTRSRNLTIVVTRTLSLIRLNPFNIIIFFGTTDQSLNDSLISVDEKSIRKRLVKYIFFGIILFYK